MNRRTRLRKNNNKEEKELKNFFHPFSTHPRLLFIELENQNINTYNLWMFIYYDECVYFMNYS